MLRRSRVAASSRRLPCSSSACGGSDTTASAGKEETSLQTLTDGKLTIGTGEPAYSPVGRSTTHPSRARASRPPSRTPSPRSSASPRTTSSGSARPSTRPSRPGPKDFDFNLQQFSITDEREEGGRLLLALLRDRTQAVVTTKAHTGADAHDLADLKDVAHRRRGRHHQPHRDRGGRSHPTRKAQAFNTNDDAMLALRRRPSTCSSSTCRPRSTSPASS